MTIRYRKLPERTRAIFERKLAARSLTVRDFSPTAVDDALRRAAAATGRRDKLSPHEAELAAEDLFAVWIQAWSMLYRTAA